MSRVRGEEKRLVLTRKITGHVPRRRWLVQKAAQVIGFMTTERLGWLRLKRRFSSYLVSLCQITHCT